jgi:hypothetical protein
MISATRVPIIAIRALLIAIRAPIIARRVLIIATVLATEMVRQSQVRPQSWDTSSNSG